MSYFKKPLVVEKRKLSPSRWKKPKPTAEVDRPVYTDIEKQLHRHTKRNSIHFPPSWWLPGDK